MSSISVILITLALFPISAALKCHGEGEGASTINTEGECRQGQQFCYKIAWSVSAPGASAQASERGCAHCKQEGCNSKSAARNGVAADAVICCCKSDYCNPSSNPSVLLSFAAITAAIIATLV